VWHHTAKLARPIVCATLLFFGVLACAGPEADGPKDADQSAQSAIRTSDEQGSTEETVGYSSETTSPAEPPGTGVTLDRSQEVLGQLTASSTPEVSSEPPTLDDTQQTSLESWIGFVGEDVDGFWAQTFQGWIDAQASSSSSQDQYASTTQYNTTSEEARVVFPYASARLNVFVGADDTPCTGDATAAMYCGMDQTVHIELQEAQQVYEEAGDFALASKIAHEWGHHVQNRLRYFDPDNPSLQVTFEERSVPFELQADCLAGVWAYYAGYRGMIEEGDVEEAMSYRSSLGENLPPEQRTHGTPEERAVWWYRGFETGDSSQCTGQEFDTGG
jgi:hypothetical protein